MLNVVHPAISPSALIAFFTPAKTWRPDLLLLPKRRGKAGHIDPRRAREVTTVTPRNANEGPSAVPWLRAHPAMSVCLVLEAWIWMEKLLRPGPTHAGFPGPVPVEDAR